mmetsp:Transcript_104642/g.322717  ORF Transcript_104642/g.322717 Transcript_104642/m.322717 type:complete len:337 (+) Transcript_104642:603-1613(+)
MAVLEDELGCHGCPHAALVVDLLAQREAGHPLLNEEQGHVAPAIAGLGVDQVGIASTLAVHGPVCDPHLGTVQYVLVALLRGGGLHSEHISAHTGLRHAHAADLGALTGRRKPLRLLLMASILGEVVDEEHAVGQVGKAEGGVTGGQLLVHNDRSRGIHAASTVLLRHSDSQQAQLAQLPEKRDVHPLCLVELGRLRLDLSLCEGSDHLAQSLVLCGGAEDGGGGLGLGLLRNCRRGRRRAAGSRGVPRGHLSEIVDRKGRRGRRTLGDRRHGHDGLQPSGHQESWGWLRNRWCCGQPPGREQAPRCASAPHCRQAGPRAEHGLREITEKQLPTAA